MSLAIIIVVGEVFKKKLTVGLGGRLLQAVFQRMVTRQDQNIAPVSAGMSIIQLQNICLIEASSISVSERINYGGAECLKDLGADSFETFDWKNCETKTKKKAFLRQYILNAVLGLYSK